jgi:hypothetical protein
MDLRKVQGLAARGSSLTLREQSESGAEQVLNRWEGEVLKTDTVTFAARIMVIPMRPLLSSTTGERTPERPDWGAVPTTVTFCHKGWTSGSRRWMRCHTRTGVRSERRS